MSGNLNLTVTAFNAEIQSRLDAVTAATTTTDLIKLYRASELFETADYTVFAAEVQSRLDAISNNTDSTELLKLAASFGKITNTNQKDLQSILAAISNSGGVKTSTGDIVETTRTTTEDGQALLPLTHLTRKLTSEEKAANPMLTAMLPESYICNNRDSRNAVSANTNYPTLSTVTADSNTIFFYKNTGGRELCKYSKGDYDITILFDNGSTTSTPSKIVCSEDGQVVVAVWSSSTSTKVVFSRDGGASFQTQNINSTGIVRHVYLAPDGKGLVILYERTLTEKASVAYWPDISLSSTRVDHDLSSAIQAAVPEWSGVNTIGAFSASHNIDGSELLIFMSYGSVTSSKATAVVNVTGLSGTPVVTEVQQSPDKLAARDVFNSVWYMHRDLDNPDLLVQFSPAMGPPMYSKDRGSTWRKLPEIDLGKSSTDNTQYGSYLPANSMQFAPVIVNGYLITSASDNLIVVVDLTKETYQLVYNSSAQYVNRTYTVSADKQTISIGYFSGNSELIMLGAILELDKMLPAVSGGSVKIVGDAQ